MSCPGTEKRASGCQMEQIKGKLHSKMSAGNEANPKNENSARIFPKMVPKLMPKSWMFHVRLKKAETLETVCFPIENDVPER